jgi:hypothetical protein
VHAPVEDKLLVLAEGLELVLREVHDDCSPTSGRFLDGPLRFQTAQVALARLRPSLPRRSLGKSDGEAPEELRTYVMNSSIWPHNSLGEVESAMVRQHPLNSFFRELPIFRVYKVQIFFYRWRSVTMS